MTTTLQKVKEELARYRTPRRCCQLAELSSLLHMDGTYHIRVEGHSLTTESTDVHTARKIYTLIHSLFNVDTPLMKVQKYSPCRDNYYSLEIPDQAGFHQMLVEVGVLDTSLSPTPTIPERLMKKDCCAAAALRGAFLGGGYVSEPYGRADFEISCSSRVSASAFAELMRRKSLEPRLRPRRNQWVIYLKARQQISEFLAVTGAHSVYLSWESQTILNATKNRVNRLVNCDAANARRLAEASSRQREAIAKLYSRGLIPELDPELAEAAEARMAHPQASLSELGQILDPPVTKAVVQGRMRKLEAILADEYPTE